MDEIEVAMKSFGDQKSTLFDQYERLSVEIQLNQAILRRSLSEPAGSLLFPAPPPPVVSHPVEQGKRGGSWSWLSFHRMVKKFMVRPRIRPIMFRRKKTKKCNDNNCIDINDDEYKEQKEPNKDLKAWRRYSKSVRL